MSASKHHARRKKYRNQRPMSARNCLFQHKDAYFSRSDGEQDVISCDLHGATTDGLPFAKSFCVLDLVEVILSKPFVLRDAIQPSTHTASGWGSRKTGKPTSDPETWVGFSFWVRPRGFAPRVSISAPSRSPDADCNSTPGHVPFAQRFPRGRNSLIAWRYAPLASRR